MQNQRIAIVEEMFKAFQAGDLERFTQTVSEDTVWIYHGTHKIPKARFTGRKGVANFMNRILTRTEVISFEPQQFITEGNTVVVIGQEHQKVKRTGEELKQRWVQIYTLNNNLISGMEEFAVTEEIERSLTL